MADQLRYAVQKLNGENYSTWSYKVKLLLMKDALWDVLSKPMPTSVDAAWTKKDEAAQVVIGLLVEDSQLRHIRNQHTARDQWEALKNYHQKATLSNKLFLYKRIFRTVLEEDGDMEEHVTKLLEYIDRLAGLGQVLQDDIVASVLLGSLPGSYDTLVIALESRPESDLTPDFVKGKLIDEYQRRKGAKEIRKSASDETVLKAVHSYKGSVHAKKTSCFFCKRFGHMKSECTKYKAWKEKQEKANKAADDCRIVKEEVCLVAQNKNSNWIIDSGATSHMVQNKDFFSELDSEKTGYVRLADEKNRVEVKGIGSAVIKCAAGGEKISEVRVNNVLYVPGLGSNLLSVRKLAKEGYKLVFESDDCRFIKDGEVRAIAEASSGLYELKNVEKACSVKEATNGCSKENCYHVWHRRFGHRHTSAIKELAEKGLATGIQVTECGRQEFCEYCVEGKMARKPFPKESTNKTKAPLELVHTDVCGPIEVITPGNKRYALTIIDDFSRYTHIYLMSHKDQVTGCIKEFVEMVKIQFNKVPKIIRSDRGREYVNSNLQAYLKSQGISIQYTAPYSPQQNGVAERKNRYLFEMSRCMLFDANLEKKYWGEAVFTANYLQNRLPAKGLSKTPFELWHSKKPDVSNLRIFGCNAYVYVHKEQRKKLDKKAEKFIFVGYSEESKAYRLLRTGTNKIKISRDVIFVDEIKKHKASLENKALSKEEFEFDITEITHNRVHNNNSNESLPEDEVNVEGSSTTSLSTNISSDHESDQEQPREPRRSERSNRGVPPDRYMAVLKLAKEEQEPRNVKDALSRPDRDSWIKAMSDEINSLKNNGTWDIVPRPADRDIITCKWVFKTKHNAEGKIERHKARLVARGFSQKYGIDYDEVFAPVVKQTTLRMLLTVAGQEKLTVKHFDAKTAFLNGELKEDIYMQQPEGYVVKGTEEMVCHLRKGIYGLKQAAKLWNDHLNDCLQELGFVQSKADSCLYIKNDVEGKIYFSIYVDDILIAAKNEVSINKITNSLNKKFQLKDLGNLKYYLGIEIRRDTDGIFYLKQTKYIEKILSRFSLQDAKVSNIPLDQGYMKNNMDREEMPENEKYQQLIGALLYLAVNTRPDIAASISILSQHNKAPTTNDWNEVKRVARYLKGSKDYELRLGNRGGKPNLIGYADADWAENRIDRKSNSGYLFQYYDSPISWACRKQACVALSSTEAEFIALAEATQEGIWIRRLLEDFEGKSRSATLIYEDNQSCLKLIDHKRFNHRTKHIDTKFHFIKDLKDQGIMEYEYCPTNEMIADMLTKPLGRVKLKSLAEKCGLQVSK